jgi:hypothetical protein
VPSSKINTTQFERLRHRSMKKGQPKSETTEPGGAAKSDGSNNVMPVKKKPFTKKRANALLIDSGEAIQAALQDLEKARELATKAGLSVDSHILGTHHESSAIGSNNNTVGNNNNNGGDPREGPSYGRVVTPKVLMRFGFTTGGHSNTDHVVIRTGDAKLDRIAELKRNLVRRARAMQPENRRDTRCVLPFFVVPFQKFQRHRRLFWETLIPGLGFFADPCNYSITIIR